MNIIEETFYLSDPKNLEKALKITGLAEDELEYIVGRFTKASRWAGQLKGEVVVFVDGECLIRDHFTKNELWRSGV
jgi:hypothetical protein